ncbi:MAG: hypothetical protein B9S37_09600 [Verrucomicrobiia bacterium Tous-C3TDCM]|nr:MAG: hypothetical protein B9S37_09600 [Verrucomicrobiae bacterium Tous-C3TDCM]PAZ04016.1 MAG: hypothetical protein CAK88_12740 [Verrucomicrobiae bacterium AMD-G2]
MHRMQIFSADSGCIGTKRGYFIYVKYFFLLTALGCFLTTACKSAESIGHLIEVPAASQLIAKNQSLRILDVRTAEEYKEGHLDGAVLVPLQAKAFVEDVKKSIKLDEPVLVYCRSGGRSARAIAILREAGYTKLQELKGGMIAWEKAKQPTKK